MFYSAAKVMEPYLAAAVQMTSTPDLSHNLTQAEALIQQAVERGASLVTLPENFSFLGPEREKLNQVKRIAATTEEFLVKTAQRFGITLLGGGFPVPASAGKVYNVAALIGPHGEELGRYRKIHLFDVDLPDGITYRESDSVLPGDTIHLVRTEKLGALGLSVCYDLRFPELYRALALQGADVLLIPSAFTAYTGKDHWRVLLQARAIENTCYVVAPAQVGTHYSRRHTYGHALVIDPWGNVMADAGDMPGVAVAQIDPKRLAQVRQQLPALQHQRLEGSPMTPVTE